MNKSNKFHSTNVLGTGLLGTNLISCHEKNTDEARATQTGAGVRPAMYVKSPKPLVKE